MFPPHPAEWRRAKWKGDGGRRDWKGVAPRSAKPLWLSKPGMHHCLSYELHDHFGKSEHSYGHWPSSMQEEWFSLWQFLQYFPEAADPKLRDVSPLRLMSWPKTTPPKSFMWEPSQATLDIDLVRSLWWKEYRPRVRPLGGSPKVPSGCAPVP